MQPDHQASRFARPALFAELLTKVLLQSTPINEFSQFGQLMIRVYNVFQFSQKKLSPTLILRRF